MREVIRNKDHVASWKCPECFSSECHDDCRCKRAECNVFAHNLMVSHLGADSPVYSLITLTLAQTTSLAHCETIPADSGGPLLQSCTISLLSGQTTVESQWRDSSSWYGEARSLYVLQLPALPASFESWEAINNCYETSIKWVKNIKLLRGEWRIPGFWFSEWGVRSSILCHYPFISTRTLLKTLA